MRVRVLVVALAACAVWGAFELLGRSGGPLPQQDATSSCLREEVMPRRRAKDLSANPQFCPDPGLAAPSPEDV
jgi:hypothetical protein